MKKPKALKEITDYDTTDVTAFINTKKPLKLSDLGFELPKEKPSQVVSLRLPSKLVNAIKSLGSKKDIPYQSLIKMFLWDRIERELKKVSAVS